MSLLSRAQDDAILHNVKRVIMSTAGRFMERRGRAQGFLRALLSPLNVELDLGESSCVAVSLYNRHHSSILYSVCNGQLHLAPSHADWREKCVTYRLFDIFTPIYRRLSHYFF